MKRFSILLSLVAAALLAVATTRDAIAQHDGATGRPVAFQVDTHAADTHAAAGDHAGGHSASPIAGVKEGLAQAITTLIAFAIVFFVLYAKVWPKISKGLDERATKIREEIAAAEAARKQAKDALDEYERSLAQARAEAQKMLDETKSQQAELAAQLRSKADAELNQLRERAKRDIESAKRAALNEIYNESVTLATTMASKILQREINPGDQAKLVEESLAELASKNN
ncbi:MAG: F0F1 ATP synthase subunit B [Phycisphaerales bacterium]|nr:F0F1 ATP synthase subunit B [Phycisphaerales bacterium]